MDGCLGVNIGSVAAKCVVIAGADKSITCNYLCTQGKPVAVVRRRLGETKGQFPTDLMIRDVCTTGSACYLTGSTRGADVGGHEVSAQFLAALYYVPDTPYCRRESLVRI